MFSLSLPLIILLLNYIIITIPALLTALPDTQNLKLPLPNPYFSPVPVSIQSAY